MKVFPFFPQQEQSDCGLACIRMVAAYYNIDFDYENQPSFTKLINEKGISMLYLTRIAEQLGFRVQSYQASFDELKSDIQLPCIVHWEHNHYMVLYQFQERNVLVADPAYGLRSLTNDGFKAGWQKSTKNNSPAFGVAMQMKLWAVI